MADSRCSRGRPREAESLEQVTALITSGAVVPLVARTLPARPSHRGAPLSHEDRPFGKVILVL